MRKHKIAGNDNVDRVSSKPAHCDLEAGCEMIFAVLALTTVAALLPYLLV